MIEGTYKKRLEEWLRRQLFEKGDCLKIVIRHINDLGQAKNEVDTVMLPKPATPDHLEDIINDISNIVEFDSESMEGGPPKYGFFAIFDKRPEDTARFLYRARNRRNDDNFDGTLDNEPPTKSGEIAMAMRHAEMGIRMLVMNTNNLLGGYRQLISELVSMNKDLMISQQGYVKSIAEMHDKKHEHEMEQLQLASSIENKSRFLDKLFLMGSVAMRRIRGEGVDRKQIDRGEAVTTSDVMILQFLESMTDEQKSAAMQGQPVQFSMEQNVALFELQRHLANKFANDKQEEDKEKKSSNGSNNGEKGG